MKRCPFCTEEIQDAAVVCKHCRRDLNPAPVAAPTSAPPGKARQAGPGIARRVVGVVVLVGLVLAVLAVIRSANRTGGSGGGLPAALRQTVRITLGNGQPTEVQSNGYSDYSFNLPERFCTVTGRIVGIAGGNKDFQAYIMDDDNFLNWKTSHNAKVFWRRIRWRQRLSTLGSRDPALFIW